MKTKNKEFLQCYFHGTKANLQLGDHIVAGYDSNYAVGLQSKYVYLTSNLSVAAWGAELATGEGSCRIYVVEPISSIEDDPNVTNKRFSGNPTNSYRTKEPLRVVGEVIGWQGHSSEEIKTRKEGLAQILKNGGQIIED